MTTIAYRDGKMVADTMASWSGDVTYNNPKLAATGSYLLGFSGTFALAQAMYDWIRHLDQACVKPQHFYQHIDKLVQGDGCTTLLAKRDGSELWYFASDGLGARLYSEYDAIGSGGKYALGAMYMGANAIEAVEAAIMHNEHTGGRIRMIDKTAENKGPYDLDFQRYVV